MIDAIPIRAIVRVVDKYSSVEVAEWNVFDNSIPIHAIPIYERKSQPATSDTPIKDFGRCISNS